MSTTIAQTARRCVIPQRFLPELLEAAARELAGAGNDAYTVIDRYEVDGPEMRQITDIRRALDSFDAIRRAADKGTMVDADLLRAPLIYAVDSVTYHAGEDGAGNRAERAELACLARDLDAWATSLDSDDDSAGGPESTCSSARVPARAGGRRTVLRRHTTEGENQMSITTPEEIEVPAEFLSAFLWAVTDALVLRAQDIEGSAVGELRQPWRAREDATMEAMTVALADRSAIIRALDADAAVPVEIISMYLVDALDYLDVDVSSLSHEEDLMDAAFHEQTRRDMTAWASTVSGYVKPDQQAVTA